MEFRYAVYLDGSEDIVKMVADEHDLSCFFDEQVLTTAAMVDGSSISEIWHCRDLFSGSSFDVELSADGWRHRDFASPYSKPYVHKSCNHLFFDKLRSLTMEVDYASAYLKDNDVPRSLLDKLAQAHELLFEVYKDIRELWP